MSDIFISYARVDRPRAATIAKALEDHGWSVWWDWRIPAGKTFRQVIQEQLDQALCVIVLWSAKSVTRTWVIEEAAEGAQRGILVPALIENIRPPLGFREIQAADLIGWEGQPDAPEFHRLCSDIEPLIGAPAKASTAAKEQPKSPAPRQSGAQTSPKDLGLLVQFLSRYTLEGQEYLSLPAAECADACAGRAETVPALRAMFAHEAREGQSLAAAVELAEELAARSVPGAQPLLDAFFGESAGAGLDSTDKMAPLDGFYLDRYLVTNREYECMIPGHRKLRDRYSDTDDQPVIYVNWYEARLFCRWRGSGFRLPTEQEWERAASWDPARGANRKYPWGDAFDPARCNTIEAGPRKTTPVGAYPDGTSACGCYDMAGNVWEWTASLWSEKEEYRVLRGGSWGYVSGSAACSFRVNGRPHLRNLNIGFRCART
jgi:hypothetical protein